MHRLLAITVLAAAVVLPPQLGAQFRGGGMRFGGPRGPMVSPGPRVMAGPNFGPAFRTFPGPRGAFGFRHFDGGFNRGFVFSGVGFGHNPHFRLFFGSPCFGCFQRFARPAFFYPYIYPAYYQPSYPASPTTVVVQSAPPADYSQNQQLVEEVEGLRQEVQQLRQEQSSRQQPRPSGQQTSALPVPATVLVFRDGRRSEIQNYAIAGKTLWILNERQAKKVLISELDVPATQAANAERGVEFSLPQ